MSKYSKLSRNFNANNQPMRLFIFAIACLTLSLTSCVQETTKTTTDTITEKDVIVAPITTYYLIRHAEKDRSDRTNRNPELTEVGHARARNWQKTFADISFDAVYSTDYNRTQQTAKPTAESRGLSVLSYDPRTLYDSDFAKATQGKTVLVVGHSNTTPSFVNAILGEERYKDIDDTNNGNVYIVRVEGDVKSSQVLHVN